MCGISGWIKTNSSYLSRTDELALQQLYFSRLRGIDALGGMKVELAKNKLVNVKHVGDPYALFKEHKDFKEFKSYLGDNDYVVLHNRLATRGNKDVQANAHPFLLASEIHNGHSISMVHNGTISHNKREKEFKGKTDSHELAKMLAAGLTPQDIEDNVWGSYALIWYDSYDGTLNFFRNQDRPLGFAKSKDAIMFSSEVYMIASSMERNGFPVLEFLRLPILEHWKWHPEDKKFEVSKITEKKSYSSYPSRENWEGEDDEYSSSSTGIIKVRPYPKKRSWPAKSTEGKKGGWLKCSSVQGYEKGSIVTFSLCNVVPTKRINQCNVEGRLVTYSRSSMPALQMTTVVVGMMGASEKKIKANNKFLTGVVTECQQQYLGSGAYCGRLIVKTIKESGEEDPFCIPQREQTAFPADKFRLPGDGTVELRFHVENSNSDCGVPKKDNIVPITRKSENREFSSKETAILTDLKDRTANINCYSCNKEFGGEGISVHRVKKGPETSNGIELMLCGKCLEKAICEDSMEKLFQIEEAKHQVVSTSVH